jgi:uncharacterized protein YdiU (UPF0061 family)
MINFNTTYLDLPTDFYVRNNPEKLSHPSLLLFNEALAEHELSLNIGTSSHEELAYFFSGQNLSKSAPCISLAYAGHQFGYFVPQLGDGRAHLLGEVLNAQGMRFDIQLKGSGQTAFSRGGDGKSALGPVLREYIVSEAMHYLGVPTSRALAAVQTGEFVQRETLLPGAILARVAASHLRIGTFEYFANRKDLPSLKLLFEYSVKRHYPELIGKNDIYLVFLLKVLHSHAKMLASWMSLGFIHGVMNTDNMSISGQTLDYGPCAFIDNFAFDRVFSSIDHAGRYAYNNQIFIAKWNFSQLASCFIPFIHSNEKIAIGILQEFLEAHFSCFEEKWMEAMGKKLGFFKVDKNVEQVIHNWLLYLQEENLDFTMSFRDIIDRPKNFKRTPLFQLFESSWHTCLQQQPQSIKQSQDLMKSVNPLFIPRNHQIQRAIDLASKGDFTVVNDLIQVAKKPFNEQVDYLKYSIPPKKEERVISTFCGT